MKKNIIMVGLTVMISLTNLAAQESIQVSTATEETFDAFFHGAKNVRWIALEKGINEAKFSHQGNACIAYFDKEGVLLQSGRRIKDVNHLPLRVQATLSKKLTNMAKKNGTFVTGLIYETLKNDFTRYYVWAQSPTMKVFLSVDNNGLVIVEDKTRIQAPEPIAPTKEVIAKKK